MKKILISTTTQFGYHTDTYMYCKYLDKTKYEVHYVGFDGGFSRKEIENVIVHYITLDNNKLKKHWRFFSGVNKLIRKERFDLLFIVDFKGSLPIRICHLFKRMILDIRTGDVYQKEDKKSFFNFRIKFYSLFFRRISVISESLRQHLHLSKKKSYILPLGADVLSKTQKQFDVLNLFYIGTLSNRNIDVTIDGLALFLQHNEKCPIVYNIVGSSDEVTEKKLIDSIKRNKLENIISFHGRKSHEEVQELFDNSNVGIAYVPQTIGYTNQPTTKLYEYALSGMVVLATNTFENRNAINTDTGVLIESTTEGFCQGLEQILKNKLNYNSDKIRAFYQDSEWRQIVKDILEPYLDK